MANKVHLVKPKTGTTFCGIETHKIYTKKGVELAGMTRLVEVNCIQCLSDAEVFYEGKSDMNSTIADKICDVIERF